MLFWHREESGHHCFKSFLQDTCPLVTLQVLPGSVAPLSMGVRTYTPLSSASGVGSANT